MTRRLIFVVLGLALAGCSGEDSGGAGGGDPVPAGQAGQVSLPAPDAALPRDPAALAQRLTETERRLLSAVDAWRRDGDPSAGEPPQAVALLALHQQRIHRLLSVRRRLARSVLALLPGRVAAHARATIRARRKLAPLSTPQRTRSFRTGPPEPAGVLLGHYRKAER